MGVSRAARGRPASVGNGAESAVDAAYKWIEDEILSQRLAPGAMLDETVLARHTGVSRTPVREALRRLQQDGLIVKIPRRGSFVTSPTTEDVLELDFIRLLLEPAAARFATALITEQVLDRLDEKVGALELRLDARGVGGSALDEGDLALDVLTLDSEIHDEVLQAVGNKRLRGIVLSLHNQLGAVRAMTAARRAGTLLAEHRELLQAMRSRDEEAAEQAMRRHLNHAIESRLRVLDSPLGVRIAAPDRPTGEPTPAPDAQDTTRVDPASSRA
jgi:DNA-binding GntR family transcriptional regulator